MVQEPLCLLSISKRELEKISPGNLTARARDSNQTKPNQTAHGLFVPTQEMKGNGERAQHPVLAHTPDRVCRVPGTQKVKVKEERLRLSDLSWDSPFQLSSNRGGRGLVG